MQEEAIATGVLASFEKHASIAIVIIILVVGAWLINGQIEVAKSLVGIQTQLVSLQHQLDTADSTRYTSVDADKDKAIVNGRIDALDQRVTNLEKIPTRR